jgi:F0F1-type ATP synthase assembly protein I
MEGEPIREEQAPASDEQAQLKALGERADGFFASRDLPEVPEWNYKRKTRPVERPAMPDGSMRGLALGLTLAYGFVGPILAGYLIGLLIDRRAGLSNQWQTWLTLAGVFAGFIFVVFVLGRTESKGGRGR